MDRASFDLVGACCFTFSSKIHYSLVGQESEFWNLTFHCLSKQMAAGMKAPGGMARRTAMESSTILTKASYMKAFGWME